MQNSPLNAQLNSAAATHGNKMLANWFQRNESITYQQLADQVVLVTSALRQLGVTPESHIAVMMPSCPQSLSLWFAIANIGAVMTPVNQAYQAEELHYVLDNSDAEYLFIDGSYQPLLVEMSAQPVKLKKVCVVGLCSQLSLGQLAWTDLLATPCTVKALEMTEPNALFSIQYTSGTTGLPKGCMLSQDYWMRLATVAAKVGSERRLDNCLIWAPFYYMDGQWQMLMTMLLGGTAHIVNKMSLKQFGGWLDEYQINYCTLPEPFMQSLDETEKPTWPLRMVNTFAWRPHNIAKLNRMYGPIGRDGFGMTEVGGITSTTDQTDFEVHTGTCGQVMDDLVKITIRDEQGQEVSENQQGELWVNNQHMLQGYYKNPKANAESFSDGWFKTGDLARIDADGYMYITGRIKEMIKRSGENISAREVEAKILQHELVGEVAIIGVPDLKRKEEVKAYVLLKDVSHVNEATAQLLINHCKSTLAAFKVPRYIEFIDELPRTPTRKVAKHELKNWPIVAMQGSWDSSDWH